VSGTQLKRLRLQLGLTKTAMAIRFGVHRNVYARWEKARKLRKIVELATAEVVRRNR